MNGTAYNIFSKQHQQRRGGEGVVGVEKEIDFIIVVSQLTLRSARCSAVHFLCPQKSTRKARVLPAKFTDIWYAATPRKQRKYVKPLTRLVEWQELTYFIKTQKIYIQQKRAKELAKKKKAHSTKGQDTNGDWAAAQAERKLKKAAKEEAAKKKAAKEAKKLKKMQKQKK